MTSLSCRRSVFVSLSAWTSRRAGALQDRAGDPDEAAEACLRVGRLQRGRPLFEVAAVKLGLHARLLDRLGELLE
jgi:hypothetical protein